MTKRISFLVFSVFFAGIGLTWSCSTAENALNEATGSAASSAGEAAGEKVGEKVGERIANQALAGLGPGNIHAYQMSMFQMFHYYGGYDLATGSYEEGEFTKWKATGASQGDSFEKTLFKTRDDGAQWWRHVSRTKNDDGKEMVYISETLLAPEKDGERNILRMRVKYPGEEEPSEVPVTKEESEKWAVSSKHELTEESMKGMTVGNEKVETPAGTFDARHLQTSKYGGAGTINWWIAEDVPGGVVKFNEKTKSDEGSKEERYKFVLTDHGTGMTDSKLGVLESSGAKSKKEGEDSGGEESSESGSEGSDA